MKKYPNLAKFSFKLNLICTIFIALLFFDPLFGQTAKGLDDFIEIPLPHDHDTLVEFEKVFAISPYIGRQYFYAMPATPENISEIFSLTENVLELNGADIENPDYNHNARNEVWEKNDGFKKMAEATMNYYKIVRREWLLDIVDENDWYVQLEVANGHAFFRSGPL